MSVAENLKDIRSGLHPGVELVAVSKFHPCEKLKEAYDAGQRIFGESRVQELCGKQSTLPDDIEWHFIGHLQTNKVKYIAPFISLIHAVDSLRLIEEIDRQARKCQRVIDCLLELHLAQEETKFGLTPEQCIRLLAEGKWREYGNVRICGLMCMASNTPHENIVRKEFEKAESLFNEIKRDFFNDAEYFCIKSWGMSHDYAIAQDCGSNMVRIGTAIFGEREY